MWMTFLTIKTEVIVWYSTLSKAFYIVEIRIVHARQRFTKQIPASNLILIPSIIYGNFCKKVRKIGCNNFQKMFCARVLHDFRDLNFVTRFIVCFIVMHQLSIYASIYTALNFLKATCPPHFKA